MLYVSYLCSEGCWKRLEVTQSRVQWRMLEGVGRYPTKGAMKNAVHPSNPAICKQLIFNRMPKKYWFYWKIWTRLTQINKKKQIEKNQSRYRVFFFFSFLIGCLCSGLYFDILFVFICLIKKIKLVKILQTCKIIAAILTIFFIPINSYKNGHFV